MAKQAGVGKECGVWSRGGEGGLVVVSSGSFSWRQRKRRFHFPSSSMKSKASCLDTHETFETLVVESTRNSRRQNRGSGPHAREGEGGGRQLGITKNCNCRCGTDLVP